MLKIAASILFTALIVFLLAFFLLPLPGQIPVLMYHFIGDQVHVEQSKNYVLTESFDKQMKFLKTFGYHVLTIDEYYETLQGTRKPRGREILITFDDGNYSFSEEALPILEKYQIPAAVFLVSGKITDHIDGSMTEAQIREALPSGLVTFGAHSRTHPFLSQLSEEAVLEEVAGSKKDLEERFQIQVDYFVYPYGDFNERVLRITEEAGYKLAFTTTYKELKGSEPTPYSIPRVKISRTSDYPFAYWFKITGLYDLFKSLRHQT